MCLFREYDGFESGDGRCSWGGDVGVVEMVSGVGMCVVVDVADNRGDGVVSSRGNVIVAGGGARWNDCFRFSDEILSEMSFCG